MRWLLILAIVGCLFSGCGKRPEEEMSQDRIDAARERVKQGEDAAPNLPGVGQ